VEAAAFSVPELHALASGSGFAPGAAAVGRVSRAGEAATHLDGQRVVVGPILACGECDACRRGHPAVCPTARRYGWDLDGAFASHVVAASRWVLPLHGALDGVAPGPAAAALGREAPLAYEMLARAGVTPGEAAIWLGEGPVARLGLEIARAKGANSVSLSHEERALPPEALPEALRARAGAPPWRVFDTGATEPSRRRGLSLASGGGTLVCLALARDDRPLPLGAALATEVAILGVAAPHPDLYPEVAALAARGDIDLAGAITVVPAAEIPTLPRRLRHGSATLLVAQLG
jgi:threonine dehydrogenase-like Zn-dependent dehydrogenase